ncbi:hypothetical protein [Oceanobacter mangrovi]|uniref:hypothetical protein n=1 Tax=Oceanobacter mangrovi TaxID=2862510 RepID=UPI001C8D33B8|nr:hypothetical protein [Oceanobacter mangrovi]
MSQRKCPCCGQLLDFQTLVLSVNPFAIQCVGCETKIRPNPSVIAVLAVVLFVLVYSSWTGLQQLGLSFSVIAGLVFVLFLGFEYLLYRALDSGLLASNLIPQQQPTAAQQAVAQAMAAAQSANAGETADQTADQTIMQQIIGASPQQLLPMIKSRAYLEQLQGMMADDSPSMPLLQPLVGDLLVATAIDTPEQRIALSPALFQQSGLAAQLTQEQVRGRAEANALAGLRTIRQHEQDGIVRLSCDNHLMATGLLFAALWDQIEQDGAVVIAVPHRDEIWFVRLADPAAIEALREAVAGFTASDNHGLSSLLYVREEGEWEVFDD